MNDNISTAVIILVSTILLYIICNNLNSSHLNNGSGLSGKIKDLDIMFLKLSSCPYCIKMESFLLSENLLHYMHVIDVQSGDGRQIAQQFNCTGFPSFVSKKTGKKTSGYTENIDKLINDLE